MAKGCEDGDMQRRNERFIERLPLATVPPWLAYTMVLLLCILALVIRIAVDFWLPTGFPYVSFFPAVILAAFFFGVGPGIFAAVLCGLFAWYFFIPTSYPFELNPAIAVALALYIFVVATQIALVHWMQRANFKLAVEREKSKAMADHRELLFRELQHRVSNNLQVAAALIALQRRNVADVDARRALDEAAERLALIGKISRTLYDSNARTLGGRAFMETLLTDIITAAGRPEIRLIVEIDDGVALNPDIAVPLALVLAEAVNNALEHGFAGRDGGTIAVHFTRSVDDRLRLEVADDGVGLPEGFVLNRLDSLGLRIASTLAQQLGGHFDMVHFSDHFPAARACAILDIPARPLS